MALALFGSIVIVGVVVVDAAVRLHRLGHGEGV
jgi:5-formyltetrahydrofolate cyclo-ligase